MPPQFFVQHIGSKHFDDQVLEGLLIDPLSRFKSFFFFVDGVKALGNINIEEPGYLGPRIDIPQGSVAIARTTLSGAQAVKSRQGMNLGATHMLHVQVGESRVFSIYHEYLSDAKYIDHWGQDGEGPGVTVRFRVQVSQPSAECIHSCQELL